MDTAGSVADLSALAARASAADSDGEPVRAQSAQAAPGAAPQGVSGAGQWRTAAIEFGGMVRTLAADVYPPLASAWTPERLGVFGDALERVAGHYGWTMGGVAAHPLTGLLVASVPLAWPLAEPFLKKQAARVKGAQAPQQAAKAEPEKAQAAPGWEQAARRPEGEQ